MDAKVLIPMTLEKRPSRHFRDLDSSPSHRKPRGLGRKNGFVCLGPAGARCSLPCTASRQLLPASQPLSLPALLKGAQVQFGLLLQRVQGIRLDGFHMVLSLQVHRMQELRLGSLCLDFRGYIKKTRVPRQKHAAGVEPS